MSEIAQLYLEYLQTKRDLLSELAMATTRSLEALVAEQEDEMVVIFDSQQAIMKQIDELTDKYSTCIKQFQETQAGDSSNLSEQIISVQGAIQKILARIRLQDQEIATGMANRREELIKGMHQLQELKRTRHAYEGSNTQSEGFYIDKLK